MTERKKWTLGCLTLLSLFALGVTLLVLPKGFSCFKERRSANFLAKDHITVIRIEDVIFNSEKTVNRIIDCEKDDAVKAILLRIESPGGGVAPSQEIYEAVWHFRNKGKPVVASLGAVAASGAYYIACAADTIVANPGTLTGSIGVIFEFPAFRELMQKVGVELEVVKSGKFKDAGGPHRRLTEEERALFQGVINDTWDQFVGAVAEGRGLKTEAVKKLADGRVFTGRQALEAGLVDTLGTFEDAKNITRALAGLPESAEVYEFEEPRKFREWLLGDTEGLLKLKGRFLPEGLNFLMPR